MIHVLEHSVSIENDLVAALALDVRDEADAARILFVGRIVQAVLSWETDRVVNGGSVLFHGLFSLLLRSPLRNVLGGGP